MGDLKLMKLPVELASLKSSVKVVTSKSPIEQMSLSELTYWTSDFEVATSTADFFWPVHHVVLAIWGAELALKSLVEEAISMWHLVLEISLRWGHFWD